MPGNDSFTKLLLHTDNSFGDSSEGSSEVHTPTVGTGCTLNKADPYFGISSGKFAGSGEVKYDDSDDFCPTDQEFALEFFFRRTRSGVRELLMGQTNANGQAAHTGLWVEITSTDVLRGQFPHGGTWETVDSSTELTDTDWHHGAFFRLNNFIRLAIDGVVEDQNEVTGFSVQNVGTNFAIGTIGDRNGLFFAGQLDEVRLTVGEAIGTLTTFPVPEKAYSADHSAPTQDHGGSKFFGSRPCPNIPKRHIYDFLKSVETSIRKPFVFPNRIRTRALGNMDGLAAKTYIPKGENHMMVGPVSLSANLSCVGNLQII